MSPDAWLERYLDPEVFHPGLERIKKAISLFPLDLSKKTVLTVGGTNGKGQTSRELYQLVLQGKTCALWTSPHLDTVAERFSKNGEFVEKSRLVELFESVQKILDVHGLKLSYYEFLFLNFLLFAKDVECLVLEVGLGGRWDAVNALDADLVLLTSISRDHQEFLGNRYDQILKEKIELGRKGRPLITCFDLKYLRSLASEISRERGFDYVDLFQNGTVVGQDNFQERNFKLALYGASLFLGKSLGENFQLLRKSSGTGGIIRFPYAGAMCHALTSHNPDGVRKGVQFLNDAKYTKPYSLVLLSFSNRRFEDAMTMVKTVKHWKVGQKARFVIALTAYEHPKAMPSEQVKELSRKCGLKFVDDIKEFIQKYEFKGQSVFLALGSNYFIGRLRKEGDRARG